PTAYEQIVMVSSIVQLKSRSFFDFNLGPTAYEQIVMVQQHLKK
ncbi:unnamed protein product, partial [Rotaria socialis]